MPFKKVRTRIAPSPTGFMHIATLWIGLYNYFFAKHNGGDFILRVEDTDRERFVEGSLEDILDNFEWAGIHFDEGPTKKGGEQGNYGPYLQSKRLDIYKKYVDELLANGHAYWCDCSSERLQTMREKQEEAETKLGYDGLCRDKGLSSGLVVRLKVPAQGVTTFTDLLRGKIAIENNKLDDQVLLKSDGFPTYHLAVVVDDHLMEISHIIRGEEWISSTPKHVLLYKAFGWEMPAFAHLPLLLNADKQKLSKRKGDVAVRNYREKGYLPEALINFLALQGWNPTGDREVYSIDELVAAFDIAKVNKSGSVVNLEKLDWLNGYYIRQKTNDELGVALLPYLPEGTTKERALQIAGLVRDRLVRLSDVTQLSGFVFEVPDYPASIVIWKKSTANRAAEIFVELQKYFTTLDSSTFADASLLQEKLKEWIQEKGYTNGEVLWPLRVALSGLEQSPPPFDIISVLGKEETLKRITIAQQKLES